MDEGIFYVDELCLCSNDPLELQTMINFTQRWSERSRLQINAEKTKIMAFHETPTQEASRLSSVPQFYLYYSSPTPSRKVLNVVDQSEYLGFCLDSKLLMHRAVSVILEKAKKAHNCVAAVTYSLRYGKHHHNPDVSSAPAQILTLWKCTVMPHVVQYLRYLPLASQIQTLQKELNSSLRRHDVAFLADVGILPLRHVQNIQLSQLCFRLRTSYASPIPLYLFRAWQTIWSTHASTKSFESRIMQAVGSLDPDRLPHDAGMLKSVCMTRIENKEKSYRYFHEKLASEIWLSELRAKPPRADFGPT